MARGLLFHSTLRPWNTRLSLHAAADHYHFPCLADTPQFLHPHHCRRVFRLVSISGYYKSVLLESSCTFVRVSLDDWFSDRVCSGITRSPTLPAHLIQGCFGTGPDNLHVWRAPQCCRCCWPKDHTLRTTVPCGILQRWERLTSVLSNRQPPAAAGSWVLESWPIGLGN